MGGARFKDHFSAQAIRYAQSRPRYPDALFDFLAACCKSQALAWDCATGNGQAAASLARHFTQVVATDASRQQIDAAVATRGVDYRVAPAEASGLRSASVDLVCVAQALHWFDLDAFFAEARRVLKPGGVLAAWCYGTCRIDPACDRLVHGLYDELDAWWPPERQLVENAYRDIDLPLPALDCPRFSMTVDWQAQDMLDYLESWSATQRCLRDTGVDPTAALAGPLAAAWGTGRRTVTWPLTLKAGRRDAAAN